jgi:hypothetical protein
VGSLVGAAPAAADVRYASPSSMNTSGNCRDADAPCRLDNAVDQAGDGDTVRLAPGTYPVFYAVAADNRVHIIGADGEQVSRLVGTASSPTLDLAYGGSVRNVYLSSNRSLNYALDAGGGIVVDRVVAVGTAGATAMQIRPSTGATVVSNSVAHTPSGAGDAIQVKDGAATGPTTLLGVTAISAGGSGIVLKSPTSLPTVKNTIARGATDLEKKHTALAPVVSYSNYRPASIVGGLTAGPGNVFTDPIFVAGAAGDVRPLTGSPTIDAGAPDALSGSLDAAGAPRVSGDRVDVGAHEYQGSAAHPGGRPTDAGDIGDDSTTGGESGDGTSGSGGSNTGPGSSTLPPASVPVLGKSVTLGGIAGTPRVRVPGSRRFVPLSADSTVPVGAVIDATRATVALTSVRDGSGQTQTGTFWGGVFKVKQSKRDAVTELVLAGRSKGNCGRARRAARTDVSASRSRSRRRWSRRLWGRDRGGRFRTRGRHGSATVRGTRWLTEDRCRGTYFKVTDGAIDVRDKRRRKTVRVERGESYLAKAKKKSRRQSSRRAK